MYIRITKAFLDQAFKFDKHVMPILYSNNTIHITIQHYQSLAAVPSVCPTTAQLRAAFEASKAREGSAGLRHDNGTLIVHLAACLDAAHAAEAVRHAAAAADGLIEHLKPLLYFDVSKSCCMVLPCCRNITKSECQPTKWHRCLLIWAALFCWFVLHLINNKNIIRRDSRACLVKQDWFFACFRLA